MSSCLTTRTRMSGLSMAVAMVTSRAHYCNPTLRSLVYCKECTLIHITRQHRIIINNNSYRNNSSSSLLLSRQSNNNHRPRPKRLREQPIPMKKVRSLQFYLSFAALCSITPTRHKNRNLSNVTTTLLLRTLCFPTPRHRLITRLFLPP